MVEIDGEPWFVAVDACQMLGMDLHAGTHRWLTRLRQDEKVKVTKREHPHLFCGSSWHTTLISESGLYKLVMRSDKKEAKAFQDWVTREVLPSIRKTGSYTMPGARKTIEAPKGAEAENVPPPL
ncbi:BRO-N domain-containing protein [Celeribacter sp. ULVN23_4]